MATLNRDPFRRSKAARKSPWMGILLGGFVALFFVLTPATILDTFEYRVLDQNFRFRGAAEPREDIVIVGITDSDLTSELLGQWPWPRDYHAMLVDSLAAAGARAIVFDIIFSEYQDNWKNEMSDASTVAAEEYISRHPEDATALRQSLRVLQAQALEDQNSDRTFWESANRSDAVFLANYIDWKAEWNPLLTTDPESLDEHQRFIVETFGREMPAVLEGQLMASSNATNPILELAAAAQGVGMINAEPDPDQIVRRIPLVANYAGRLFFSLDLLVICDLLEVDPGDLIVVPGQFLEIPAEPPIRVPIDADGRMLINFQSAGDADPYLSPSNSVSFLGALKSASDWAAGEVNESFDFASFENRIVLVGFLAAGNTADQRAVFFEGTYPLVGVHAHVIGSILNRDFIRSIPPWLESLILIALGVLVGAVFYNLSPIQGAVGAVLLLAFWYAVVLLLFTQLDTIFPTVRPVIVIVLAYTLVVLYNVLIEQSQRRYATRLLGSYVNRETINEILANPDLLRPGGHRTPVTVLFSDIRGFTSLAERISAEEVVALLNEHFGIMTDIIYRWDGTLDKFVGDEIMALFGVPKPQQDGVVSAVRAAIEMQVAMHELQEKWVAEGRESFGIAIGIHHGEAVVGHLGTERKLQYTAIGDTVNLANRLENQAKSGQIMVTRAVAEQVRKVIPVRRLQPIRVKGKAEPIDVYEVELEFSGPEAEPAAGPAA